MKQGHIKVVHSGGPNLFGHVASALEGLINARQWKRSEGGQPHPRMCAAWLWASSHLLKKRPPGCRGVGAFSMRHKCIGQFGEHRLGSLGPRSAPIVCHPHGPYSPSRGEPGRSEQLRQPGKARPESSRREPRFASCPGTEKHPGRCWRLGQQTVSAAQV